VNGVAWVYGIARHQLSRFYRTGTIEAKARGSLGMNVRDLPAEDYERIEELVDLAPIREALVEALATLGAEQRDALQLRVIDELSYPDVASRLGAPRRRRVSASAAARRIDRAAGTGPQPRHGGRVMETEFAFLQELETDLTEVRAPSGDGWRHPPSLAGRTYVRAGSARRRVRRWRSIGVLAQGTGFVLSRQFSTVGAAVERPGDAQSLIGVGGSSAGPRNTNAPCCRNEHRVA
jgi:hypothetical protein